jgi:hypothetical protein
MPGHRTWLGAALAATLATGCTQLGAAPAGARDPASGPATASVERAAAEPSPFAVSSRNPAGPLDASSYGPVVDPGDFVRVVDNPFLPLTPGHTHVYASEEERIEVSVTFDTRVVAGVTTVVVIDRSFVDGELTEEIEEWFAQDRWGNVWYFGERPLDATVDGVAPPVDAWTAGIGGAEPGIVMLGAPRPGDLYRQEFLRGAAEDMARIVSTGHRIEVPYGSFANVLMTEDWNPLEPGALETKLYAPAVGLIATRPITADGSELVLIEVRPS